MNVWHNFDVVSNHNFEKPSGDALDEWSGLAALLLELIEKYAVDLDMG